MITINGAQGEGGGQIFRTALTLSMCLKQPVRIENIRAGRQKPGLLRQHLACLNAAKAISNAEVEGDHLGSQTVSFRPGKIQAGDYHFAVGSAGSTTLIFQVVLLPLLMAERASTVQFEGGTHNGMAPSFDFIEHSFLPILSTLGCNIEVALEQYGFYPVGGGRWQASIEPLQETIKPLTLVDRGKLLGHQAVAISSKIPEHVGARELAQVQQECGWSQAQLHQKTVHSMGPGNVMYLLKKMSNSTAVFTAFGEKRVKAEQVARKAIESFMEFNQSRATVCEHLADQLILPLALGQGGVFRTTKPSMHLRTNIDVVQQMTGVHIDVSQIDDTTWEVNLAL